MLNPMEGGKAVAAKPQTLPSLVRHWVHYDNETGKHNKLATASRKEREKFENLIIHSLQSQNMLGAKIQISDATLQVIEDRVVPTLTMTTLEAYLHAYFLKKGNNFDETDAIMNFIRQQKTGGARTGLKLKRSIAAPALPQ
jgi:hypothetical protein